jgi:hypothetical protein
MVPIAVDEFRRRLGVLTQDFENQLRIL